MLPLNEYFSKFGTKPTNGKFYSDDQAQHKWLHALFKEVIPSIQWISTFI